MPFIVAPPEDFEDALLLTVIDADHSEVDMLRDLRDWGWNIVRRDSQDPEFIDALAQIEKDIRRRRRRTHAIAGEITGYRERPTLEEVWEVEARKKQRESLWILPEEDEDEEGDHVGQMREPESLLTDETHSIRHGPQNMVPSRVSAHIIWADRTEAQMAWLRAMNRTRQANEHLEYQGILDEAPRLLTIGLDHVVNNSEVPKQSAREYYGRDDSHRKVTQALQNCATRVRTWGEKGGGCLRTEEKENHARRRPTSIYARMSAPDDKVITAFSASIGLKL